MHSKIIVIVSKKFRQTCTGYIVEFDFCLCTGHCCLCSLNDILLARTCRLNHLVDCAVTLGEIGGGKVVGEIIKADGLLVEDEVLISFAAEECSRRHGDCFLNSLNS